jgi:hypothetical protein
MPCWFHGWHVQGQSAMGGALSKVGARHGPEAGEVGSGIGFN